MVISHTPFYTPPVLGLGLFPPLGKCLQKFLNLDLFPLGVGGSPEVWVFVPASPEPPPLLPVLAPSPFVRNGGPKPLPVPLACH